MRAYAGAGPIAKSFVRPLAVSPLRVDAKRKAAVRLTTPKRTFKCASQGYGLSLDVDGFERDNQVNDHEVLVACAVAKVSRHLGSSADKLDAMDTIR